MRIQITAAAISIIASTAVHADVKPLTQSITECSTQSADQPRLACYDALAKTVVSIPAPSMTLPTAAPTIKISEDDEPHEPPPALTGKWELTTDTSSLTDDRNDYAMLVSENSIPKLFNGTQYANIFVRCRENTTSFHVSLGDTFLADSMGYGEVTYRFDKERAKTISMDESTNNQALGLWDGRRSIPFLKEMIGKHTLVMRVTPFNASAVEVTFDVTGFEEAVKDIRSTCKW